MLEKRAFQGYWFLPETPERKLPGTLNISPTGLELDLNGVLSVKDAFGPAHPLVFGVTAVGKPITLENCTPRSWLHPRGYATARYDVATAYVGMHLLDLDASRFRTFRVRLGNQQEFVGTDSLSLATDEQGNVSAMGTQLPTLSGKLDGYSLSIEHYVLHSERPSEVAIRQESTIRFDCDAPLTINEFHSRYLAALHTLIEFTVHGPVPLCGLFAATPDSDAEGDGVEVMFDDGQQQGTWKPKHRALLAFTLRELGEKWTECLRNWQRARAQYGPTFDLFFSLHRMRAPIEPQFLAVAQALESYHRRAFPEHSREDPIAFKERKRRLCRSAPKSDRVWLLNAIQYANELRLSERIAELWDMMPSVFQKRTTRRDEFANRMAAIRNYLTHYTPPRKGNEPTFEELVYATRTLRGMLHIIFLRELKLDIERVLHKPWGNRVLASIRFPSPSDAATRRS